MRRARGSAASRRGVALIGALVVVGVVTVLVMTIAAQMLANRRLAERRADHLQADWLARAGVELAAGRLLGAEGYTGETAELVPRSQVRVTVRREEKSPGTFRVISEAHFPSNSRDMVTRTLTRKVRRVADEGRVRVEALPAEESE